MNFMQRAKKPHFDGTEKSATIPNAMLDKQDGLNPWPKLSALEAENAALRNEITALNKDQYPYKRIEFLENRVAELETMAGEMLTMFKPCLFQSGVYDSTLVKGKTFDRWQKIAGVKHE